MYKNKTNVDISLSVGNQYSAWRHGVNNVSHPVFFHLQACRPQKQPKAHSAHPQNVHENQVQPAPSPASSSAPPAPLWALTLNPAVCFPASGSESEATPEKRPRADEKEGSGEEARRTPKQKNRRRCYRCQTKLELVQQELGSCRCGQYQNTSVAPFKAPLASTFVPLLLIWLTRFPHCGWKCVRR